MGSGTLALQVGCSINIDSINSFSNAKDLDYDFGQKIYSLKFNLTDAEDRFGNQMSLPNSLLVNINDIPDQPPLWTSPCFFQTFEEEMSGKSLPKH